LGSDRNFVKTRSRPSTPPYLYFRFSRYRALAQRLRSRKVLRSDKIIRKTRLYGPIHGYTGTCIFYIGANRDLSKSSSGRTGRLRSTKLSLTIGLGHPTSHARNSSPPTFGSAARWRQIFIFDRQYLCNYWRYRDLSFSIIYISGVPLQRPWHRGARSQNLGVRSPQPKIHVGGP